MPQVAILEGPREPSPESLEAAASRSQCFDLAEALEIDFPDDYHFVTYRLVPKVEGKQPLFVRVTKRGQDKHLSGEIVHRLGADEVREAGYDIVSEYLVGDWDRDGHATWPDDDGQSSAEALVDAIEACQKAGAPLWAAYTSRAGLRLIWRLSHPVPVEQAERLLAGLVQRLRRCDLYLDAGCLDWTRLFRLPRVLRDGVEQAKQSWFHLQPPTGETLALSSLKEADPYTVRQAIATSLGTDMASKLAGLVPSTRPVSSLGPRPSAEPCEVLAWREHPDPTPIGRAVLDGMHKNHAQALRYGSAPVPSGSRGRNSSVVRTCGALVRAARKVPEASPELLYGLMTPWLSKFESLPGDEDWYELAWRKIEDFWSRDGLDPDEDESLDEPPAPQVSLFEREQRLLEGFRESNPALCEGREDDEVWEMIADFSILGRNPAECFRLLPNGLYFPEPERWAKCVHRLLEDDCYGQQVHDRYRAISDDGKIRIHDDPRAFDKIGHTGQVNEVRYSSRKRDSIQIDSDGRTSLNMQIHQPRADIEPMFHEKIYAWLRELFSADWKVCERYLQCVTYAHRPITALIMLGAPNTGKSLLMAALGSCFHEEGAIRSMGSSRFNDEALKCPVWVYDEALPSNVNAVKRFDSYLREMISGGWIPIERKGQPIYHAEMFPRFVFAANNDSILKKIFGSNDLSIHDQDALSQRLLICRVGANARERVDEAKGYYGDEPKLLQACVEHLMWMRDQAELLDSPDRFLVSGSESNHSEIVAAAIRSADTIFLANVMCKIVTVKLREVSTSGKEGLYKGTATITVDTFTKAVEQRSARGAFNYSEVTPMQQLKRLMERHRISYKEKKSVASEGSGGRRRGVAVNLLAMMEAFMPSLDIELNLTVEFDRFMEEYYPAEWPALKKKLGYE